MTRTRLVEYVCGLPSNDYPSHRAATRRLSRRRIFHRRYVGLAAKLAPLGNEPRASSESAAFPFIQDPDHAGARNRRPDLDREGLPIAFVEDIEGPKPTARRRARRP